MMSAASAMIAVVVETDRAVYGRPALMSADPGNCINSDCSMADQAAAADS